ncbi:MAG TPA: DivIVA domain-containing protein [Solirubrobacteraceae bacterium]|nr:DivIVA domain-containing protein [Solirubrobacteraceae bacterium]
MSELDRPGATVDRPTKRKQTSSRLADLGDRIARTFTPTVDRTQTPGAPWDVATEAHYAVTDDVDAHWDDDASTFPVVRSGYDRDAVDAYLNELEQEIDELRAHRNSDDAVSTEIKRIGEQAAAILQTAHQQAAETTRKAREEAEKCLADAAANAISMKDEAKSKLRELDTETDAVWRERSRLIDDVRNVATALFSLSEEATERFPSEDDKRAASGARVQPVGVPASAAAKAQPVAAPPAAPPATAPAPSGPTSRPSPQAPISSHPATPPRATGPISVARGENHVRGLDDGGNRGPFRES